MDPAGNIPLGDASAAGFHEHTTNARDGSPMTAYEEVLERNRSRLPDKNSGPQIKPSAGDRSVVSHAHVGKDQAPVGVQFFDCPLIRR
ncbi:unnamed protein product [Dibothriocephalus latus]|uniref:Uncharacterized protein n=1 Tax=Dibothriocephalus latus TaxID=60516 RepID=A0A3P7PMJ5_DIBLA|nr:unnamed protein product [Dibothriocephalus latus]